MAKSVALHLRTSPEVEAALKQCAADDDRSAAHMIEIILREGLIARGYLPAPAKTAKAAAKVKSPKG
jgi:hypothetical protein